MCDDITEAENAAHLQRVGISRRAVALQTGGALAALWSGCTPTQKGPSAASAAAASAAQDSPNLPTRDAESGVLATVGRNVSIETPEGTAEGFFVAPDDGRHPGVLVWPDVAGLRSAYKTMATRLASEGYAVLTVNQYYRSTQLPVLTTFAEWRTEAGRAKIRPMREAITPEGITRDAQAFVRWLDAQPEVDPKRKLGASGYCMGGPFTFRTAAAVPERLGAIASFHGGRLVTDQPSSPHGLLASMKAAALICIAENDDARQPEAKTALRRAAEAAQIPAEIEVYPARHGWCTIDSPVYDEAQAERAWARMRATFERHL